MLNRTEDISLSRIIGILFHLSLAVAVCCVSAIAQENNRIRVGLASQHPEKVVDVSDRAQVKAFLPKSEYRFNELLVLDVGMLVSSDREYLYPRNLRFRIEILDDRRNRVSIRNLISFERSAGFEPQTTAMLRGSSLLLVGCDEKTLNSISEAAESDAETDERYFFSRNLFRTFPENCIDIKRPGTLEISVEAINEHALIDGGPSDQTAIFRVRSNKLKIKLIK